MRESDHSRAPGSRSIALLDLHARTDQFQDDASLGALASDLEAAGHRVALVRSVLASDPGGSESWRAHIAEFIRRGDFEVVVLARVWDEATIDVIRGALREGGRVVRLTSGVAAALDSRLDHVIDVDGLKTLLSGAGDPPAAAWRPTKPAELRRRAAEAPNRLRVLAPASLPGLVEAEIAGRPTISGPASGCPFLLDSSKNPIFAALGADPSKVQTKGCSFCLDNTGSYAAPTEEAALGAWLSQLHALRASNPRLREVLLTDERPHPYLPAFFRAISGEPPIELLFKSRVDWLLEFADTAIAEAAAVAAKSGSVLHLYLVGFESFDQFHLDLFNKGVTVADNVAAIEKLRDLADRFPSSFEYRRFRAHGIVLFTPWTRPEALLENAHWMRVVRFHELRSEAIRTRLRLYPRVPLHALAERDGLLIDAFDVGRPDRAVEQGYDASIPWRFQDERIEAVFQAANALSRASSLGDADLLELATHSVLRFPGLATTPEVAWLPMREALRATGGDGPRALDGLPASVLGFDPEIELLARGHKRACLKEGVRRADAEGLCRAYRAMGFMADVVEHHGLHEGPDAHSRGTDYAVVAVADGQEALDGVLTAQRAHGSGERRAAVETMGTLMGYPSCCVQAFLEQVTRGDNLGNEKLTFRRAPHEPLHPLLHRVGAVRLVSHHPCSPSCVGSIRIGEEALAALASIDAHAAEQVASKLERPVLFLDYQRRIELVGRWEGPRFLVDDAVLLDEPRHLALDPTAVASVELSTSGVRFTLRDGTSKTIGAAYPLLTSPGAPLAATAVDAIGGSLDAPSARTLPPTLRAGVRVRDYRILSVGSRGSAWELVLQAAQHRFTVLLRAHDPATPSTLRRGSWGIDIDRPEELPEAARLALGVLIRAL